jgi:ssDNA-binding Zn-finger/Zn-ribbon topoisomerase 1
MNQKVYELLKEETERFENGDKTIPVCSICGRRMTLRNGKFGEFWGCTGYPNCKNTINIFK